MEHSPRQIAERLVEMSAEYSLMSDHLEKILIEKPRVWMEIRENCKSDTAAERAWSSTEMGKDEMKYRLRLKALEKKMSAGKAFLKVASDEAHNMY